MNSMLGKCGVWACLLLAGCATARPSPEWISTGRRVMVASDSVCASQAGLEVLRAGGNAFDAAAAVSFALAVVRPQSTGLGGGGFTLARLARSGQMVVSDSRETAPGTADGGMFERAVQGDPDGPDPSRYGYLAVAVPGLLAGRVRMLERYGSMSLADVLAPAIRLARAGFAVDEHYVEACTSVLKVYERYPTLKESCGYVYRTHLRGGALRRPGDRLVQPALARLLEAIAAGGVDVFYRGPVADAIDQKMREYGGVVRKVDLAGYRLAKSRRPIEVSYRDYTVVAMPPPSSGGIALAESLNILETFDLGGIYRRDPVQAGHLIIEAMKHAFADRARHLGDADYVKVPTGLLTSKAYAQQLASIIDRQHPRTLEAYGVPQLPEDGGTSHFCVVDGWGNCVVSTETINTSFGSLAGVEEWGLILNNEMDDFTARPGEANAYGLIQAERNRVEAGKRPLSSMTPTMVLRDGEPFLLLGASGGPRIISSVLNVLLDVTDFGMSLEAAMQASRVHHQWRPDRVYFDAPPAAKLAEGLAGRGHRISAEPRTGIVQAIMFGPDGLIGASDPRKGGQPAGD
ncbi:MAG: gamma-glutamyltransferase [Phycisphaerae bacterium]